MPWSPSQHRLFAWAAKNPEAAKKSGYNIPKAKAEKMMKEGVKKPASAIHTLGRTS